VRPCASACSATVQCNVSLSAARQVLVWQASARPLDRWSKCLQCRAVHPCTCKASHGRTFSTSAHGHNESRCTIVSREVAPPLQARRLTSATKDKRSAAGQERKRCCGKYSFRRKPTFETLRDEKMKKAPHLTGSYWPSARWCWANQHSAFRHGPISFQLSVPRMTTAVVYQTLWG